MAGKDLRNFRFGLLGFGKAVLLALMVLLLQTQIAIASKGGIPGPPPVTPPPPPCISTAPLSAFNQNAFVCLVRNVGTASHNVTIKLVDFTNTVIPFSSESAPVPPGMGLSGGATPTPGPSPAACVVTTDEGTTDALQDLEVVLQQFDASNPSRPVPIGETEGKIFQQCTPPVTPPS